MYMLLNTNLVINICSPLTWSRPYPWWYFTIFLLPMFSAGPVFRLSLFWYVFPQDRQLLGCFFGRWFLIIPCSFFFCSVLAVRSGYSFLYKFALLTGPPPAQPSLFLTGYFDAQVSGFRCLSPAPPRLFLTGYFVAQVSGCRFPSPAPPRLFWPAILTPRCPLFGTLPPAPPRLLLTGYLDA